MFQVTLAPRRFELLPSLLNFLLDLRRALHLGLFRLPNFLQVGVFTLQAGDVFLEFFQALQSRLIIFFLQRLTLNFELNQAALQAVKHLWLGVDFHADTAGRLVNQVDGFIRQLAVGDIAMAQLGRRDNCAVGNGHLVVHLVALFKATQDGDGVLFTRLIHQYFLETPLQRGILFDVLTVLVEGGRAHTMQLTASQSRLEHIAGVH